MRVSIIVPAFNEEKLLGASLTAIKAATRAWTDLGWEHELIVCDNNSTDRTAAIATEHGAHVVFEPINQIARARNRGASIAQGDWLLFIDADSAPSAGLFADLAAAIQTGRHLACGATLRFHHRSLLLRFLATTWRLWSRTVRHMAGAFVAVEADAFREVDGFSAEFYAGEELDLSRRLKRLGHRRQPRQTITILAAHPLDTSSRKVTLYTTRELLTVALRYLRRPRQTLRHRDAVSPWYDGRR